MSSIRINNHSIEWRVRRLMKQAGIPSMIELHRKLLEIDPDTVRFVRLSQVVARPPARINTRLLLGMAIVFGCEIGDIIRIKRPKTIDR